MKKTLFFCSCLLAFSMWTGCSNKENTATVKKDQVLWLYETATPEHEKHLRTDLIDVVNSRADDYEFSIKFDANFDQNVRTQMLAGAGPDLVQTAGPSYVQEFAKEGYLLPLDKYAEEYGWNKSVFPMMLDLGTTNGHLYALPKTYESLVLFYNKTLFEENGWKIPKTWEEFETLCSTIKAQNVIPLVSGNASWKPTNEHYVTVFLNHLAGPENIKLALEGKKAWTDPEFKYAMNTMVRYFKEYFTPDYFSYTDEDSLSVLADGSAAMFISGTWNFQRIGDFFAETNQEWDWTAVPSATGIPYPLYSIGIGATLSINAKTARPDAVAELLNTLFSDKQVIVDLNVDWPGEWNLPINTIDRADFGDKIDPRYARCIDDIGDAVNAGQFGYVTWTFWPEKTNQYLWEAFEKMILGSLSVDSYLSNINDLFQKDLAAGAVPKLP